MVYFYPAIPVTQSKKLLKKIQETICCGYKQRKAEKNDLATASESSARPMSFNLNLESLNTTLQTIAERVELFAGVALKAAVDLRGKFESLTGDFSWQNGPIEFTDLQATLLKVLLVLLLGTCVLIGYSWSVYGQVITEKFVRPSMRRGEFPLNRDNKIPFCRHSQGNRRA